MAFAAIGMAAGAGAVAAGVATAATVIAVGVTAAIVGKVTGSKELTRLGMGASLGGAGAGWLGLGETAAAGAGETAAAMADEAVASGGGMAGSYAGSADAASAAAGGVAEAYSVPTPQVQDLTAAVPEQVTAVNAPGGGQGLIQDAMSPSAMEPVNPLQPISAPESVGASQVAAPMQAPAQAPQVNLFDHVNEAERLAGVQQRIPTSSFWEKVDRMGQWMEKNKALTYAGVMMGGGVLSGIQKQQELDRYFDFKNQELGLQKQIAYNRSTAHSSAMPGGVISAARG